MKNIITLLILLITVTVYGQKSKQIVPGYRGLKFTVKYDLGVNPSWNDIQTARMPVLFHNIELAYVLTRKHEISLRYARNNFKSSAIMFGSQGGYNTGSNEYEAFGDYRYNANSITAAVKFYNTNRGYIAPVGRYVLLGINYLHAIHRIPYSANFYTNGTLSDTEIAIRKITTHDFSLTIGMGRNFIVANRIVLSLEGVMNIPVSATVRALTDNYISSPFLGTSFSDNALKNLFQFKIGIGALAF